MEKSLLIIKKFDMIQVLTALFLLLVEFLSVQAHGNVTSEDLIQCYVRFLFDSLHNLTQSIDIS